MSETPSAGRGFDKEARVSYGSYLQVPELLRLQKCLSEPVHHDELQFIVVHQVFELWFKLMIFELETVRAHMLGGNADEAEHLMRRAHAIGALFAPTLHVLETMSPADFLGFRDHLRPASGFQSIQFRELEVLSGLSEPAYLEFLRRENTPEVAEAVDRRLNELSLREALFALLQVRGIDVGWKIETREWDAEKVRAELLTIHRERSPRDIERLLEALVQHDETFALWRQHHVALVERQIGARTGTGGSTGAAYLRSTTRYRFFPELWQVRVDLDPEGY